MFPNEQSAIDYLAGILWQSGVVCGHCGGKTSKTALASRISTTATNAFYEYQLTIANIAARRSATTSDFAILVGKVQHRPVPV
jgi:hypothetical protein